MAVATRVTDVDGVPALVASTSGPLRAGLMFRVGRVDESLATGGITHLVEHLALHRHGSADYHYNGMTSATTTQFVIQGTPEVVVSFLNEVCVNLRDLPVDRLASEKKIVDTEAIGRSVPINSSLALWRHGARDFGLTSYPELGIYTVTAQSVTDWAATRFNRANAVLWIAGDQVPAGLKLDLPDGNRWGLPAESSAVPVLPAYFTSGLPMIVLDARVPRTGPATLYKRAVERALFRELRQKLGLSYTAAAHYSTDGRALATITAIADAQPDQFGATLDCFLAELRRLADTELGPEELAAIRSIESEGMNDPDIEAGLLVRRATDLLTGFASRSSVEILEGFRTTTAADVREIAGMVNRDALLMLPAGIASPPAGFEAAPRFSRYAVTGKRFRSRMDYQIAVVQGSDGISQTGPQGAVTIPYDACEAMLRWPDGARQLFGTDGMTIRIEPTIDTMPAAALAALDRAIPAEVVIDMPARDPAAVPRPSRRQALRTRWRRPALVWRARFDRAVRRLPRLRSTLIALVLALTAVITIGLQVAHIGRASGVGVICLIILVVRRTLYRHW